MALSGEIPEHHYRACVWMLQTQPDDNLLEPTV